MDKQKLYENVEKYLIGLDEEFRFKCRECGKCCKNRDDILLSPRDIYNSAKKLELSAEVFIDKYCELYIGQTSRIPIVRLRPIGVNRVCTLLEGGRCLVHDAKPIVCAMYPIGRCYVQREGDGIKTVKYLKMPVNCASLKYKHTVRSWLERFNLSPVDKFSAHWFNLISVLAEYTSKGEQEVNPLRGFLANVLYTNYRTDEEFIPQFNNHVILVERLLQELKLPCYDEFRRINEHFISLSEFRGHL